MHSKNTTSIGFSRKLLLALLAAALAAALFAAGYFSGRGGGRTPAAAAGQSWNCTVRYVADGKTLSTESVPAGGTVQGAGYPETDGMTVIAWLDANGNEAEPAGMTAYTDLTFTAVLARTLRGEAGYFPCSDGLFRPEAALTRREAAELLYGLLADKPPADAALTDVAEDDAAYEAASALVSAGLMEAVNGVFEPDGTFTETSFAALLDRFFRAKDVAAAVGRITGIGSETVTRAEAAVSLNRLLGVAAAADSNAYWPDVGPDYWARGDVLAAAGPGRDWAQAKSGVLPEGFLNVAGYLYHVESDGYFLKNGYIGSLFFDGNGRYTSGSAGLDDDVAAAIRENTDDGMDREEMLRAMFVYVRDGFHYLRRNYYDTGETGWALKEATTMYSTGQGNCYCYAAAFWAAARGLGYDARAVSGTIGSEKSPHGWVEIPMDGGLYVFDVEIEMAYIRDGKTAIDMFKMEHLSAKYSWLYVQYVAEDDAAPRACGDEFDAR